MRRIAVVGPGGAGKTTLSRELARRLALPFVHLDAAYWRPGWRAPPREDWLRAHARAIAGDDWIADGNYGSTMDKRFAAADSIVFLDPHPAVCILRVMRRQLRWLGRPRPDLPPGCVERLAPRETLAFWRYIWGYRRERRPAVLARIARHGAGKHVRILRSSRDVERFLVSLRPRREPR